jgi:hypothetical protein
VLALQDTVDALEQSQIQRAAEIDPEKETTVETGEEEEKAEAPKGVVKQNGASEESGTAAEMVVDGGTAAGEPSATEDTEQAPDVASHKPADEGEWEIVDEEDAAAVWATVAVAWTRRS